MNLVLAVLAVLVAATLLYWVPLLLVGLVGFPYLVVFLGLVRPWIVLVLALRALRTRKRVP